MPLGAGVSPAPPEPAPESLASLPDTSPAAPDLPFPVRLLTLLTFPALSMAMAKKSYSLSAARLSKVYIPP